MTEQRTVHLVPHTHWDREWYLTFQTFRMRLVELVDSLLERMTQDPRLAFTLDGQLATVDDYLEIRPEDETRLRALVGSGRLAIGPWQILMDEWLVSGETIVRNLEVGWHRAEELGRVMAIGYLPDMFGHVAQMPQILRRAGIEHAVVWRGVPAAINRHAFRWVAPDGSAVRTEYLYGGYGNARGLFDLPDRVDRTLAGYVDSVTPFFGDDDILAMYGEDHSVPRSDYGALVEAFNAAGGPLRIRIGTLADYLRTTGETDDGRVRVDGLPTWHGELRSGARANILMGVTSHRLEVKQAAGRAERLLARYAEPLGALHGPAWPARYLELAWRRVIEDSAHDSICACSLDAVVDQVLVRLAEATQIAEGLVRGVAADVARAAPRGTAVVLNPSPRARADLVELELPVPHDWPELALELPGGRRVPTQEVGRNVPLIDDVTVAGRDVPELFVRRFHGRELYGYKLNGYRLEPTAGSGRVLTLEVDTVPEPPILDVEDIRQTIVAAALEGADEPWHVRIEARSRRRVLARVPAPALGWSTVRPIATGGPLDPDAVAITPDGRGLVGPSISVAVTADGTLAIHAPGVRLLGAGRLVDGGDVGDSYNYGPPANDTVIERPVAVSVEPVAAGPLRAAVAVVRSYDWPAGLVAGETARTAETRRVEVTTTVELRAGEGFVRLTLAFDNQCLDHRVRFHVPLPEVVDGSLAEGQFAIVRRGLTAEGGHGETPLPTFPAHGFVAAGAVAALLEHVVEYELVDGGRELALTLLRATGLISRNVHPYREDPAGPVVAIPGSQGRGPRRIAFALLPRRTGDGVTAPILEALEDYRLPFVTADGTGEGTLPLRESTGLRVSGEGVVVTTLRRRDEDTELRLVNESDRPTTAGVEGKFGSAHLTDLLGRPGGGVPVEVGSSGAGRLELALRAWEIATVRLEART